MVEAIKILESTLESLRETCSVRKHNPFGPFIEEYEKGVYIVKGTYEDLKEVLELRPTYPLKINVILVKLGKK